MDTAIAVLSVFDEEVMVVEDKGKAVSPDWVTELLVEGADEPEFVAGTPLDGDEVVVEAGASVGKVDVASLGCEVLDETVPV
jgi:hypothetical protein